MNIILLQYFKIFLVYDDSQMINKDNHIFINNLQPDRQYDQEDGEEDRGREEGEDAGEDQHEAVPPQHGDDAGDAAEHLARVRGALDSGGVD